MANPISYPQPLRARFLGLDAWRGLACLMIVVGHALHGLEPADWERAGGSLPIRLAQFVLKYLYLGVPMFFVISGYCIAATVDSTRLKGRGWRTYFRRRLRRIFPPYWVFLGLLLLLSLAAAECGFSHLLTSYDCYIPPPQSLTWQNWLGSLTLTESWRWHFLSDPRLFYFGPAWTLCYEEQFYAVCGLLLWLAPHRFWSAIVGVTLLTLIPTTLSFMPEYSASVAGFFFDGRWLVFAAGILVYFHVNHATPRQRRMLWLVLGLAFVAAALVRFRVLADAESDRKTLAFEMVVAAQFALILILHHRWDARWAGFGFLRPLTFCGRICYSLYLVHYPVTILVSHAALEAGIHDVVPTLLLVGPLGTGLSILLAWWFFVAVEQRFLNPPVAASE